MPIPLLLALIFISFFLLPTLSLVFFCYTLYDLVTLHRERREAPNSIRPEEIRRRHIRFLLAASVFACVALIL